mmetsp:Transcript_4618/g.10373  ORF Transcript_4618/g.10373 Transcript_4618/m.10373 type:complete len:143 (+) Transcript_4618:749-1177(+)|eukprot:CAMPEP_0116832122 /NCGR_PEP_ID=MMETSP0418-20121206/5719_1 /TAXON_ID=1158023 /ORGANISM="Astrosyne radiata, Strain 13vi08-1A" /LENGTH=142 /DNA_ID=CAMNT_0004461453 /DNA_START=851 /DNA_END=1279 /DNA_ORIENTATION=+
MIGNVTFSMIKPHAVQARHVGAIIHKIEQARFNIQAMKLEQLTLQNARLFYQVHKDQPFYEQMCTSMTHGPVVALVLEKANAVTDFRKLIGATDPARAAAGTIRAQFGKSIEANAIHGSDANITARIEAEFFFPNKKTKISR